MKTLIIASIVAVVVVLLFLAEFKSFDKVAFKAESSQSQQAKLKVHANYGRLPMHFEPNKGQAAEEAEFVARGRGYTLLLKKNEAQLLLRNPDVSTQEAEPQQDNPTSANRNPTLTKLRMQLVDANLSPQGQGVEELPGKSHYFIGKDPGKWQTDVPNYAKVKYEEVYPGIDLVYYGKEQQLEFDFVVSPGVDPASINLAFEGQMNLSIDDEGNLTLPTDGGDVTVKTPRIYQEIDDNKLPVEGRFIAKADNLIGFELGEYNPDFALVIDPVQ